jgi:hypothetical protein
MRTGYQWTNGTAQAADGDVDKTVIAAVTGKVLRVTNAVITVHTAAAGNAGKVALEDGAGGTRFFEADADAVGGYNIDFGPIGYPLTVSTALNLTVDGDGVTEATAKATVTGYLL